MSFIWQDPEEQMGVVDAQYVVHRATPTLQGEVIVLFPLHCLSSKKPTSQGFYTQFLICLHFSSPSG
jgi:hypothetical protein